MGRTHHALTRLTYAFACVLDMRMFLCVCGHKITKIKNNLCTVYHQHTNEQKLTLTYSTATATTKSSPPQQRQHVAQALWCTKKFYQHCSFFSHSVYLRFRTFVLYDQFLCRRTKYRLVYFLDLCCAHDNDNNNDDVLMNTCSKFFASGSDLHTETLTIYTHAE